MSRRWYYMLLSIFSLAGCGDGAPPNAPAIQVLSDNATQVKDAFDQRELPWREIDGKWQWRKSEDQPVLAQTATDRTYPLILLDKPRFSDVDVRVRFKPLSGKSDASGGIVFRAKDDRNYYLVRGNALEDNFRLYKITDGSRGQIAGTTVTPPALGQWHTLHVIALGNHIQAFLDDKLLIDHHDSSYTSGAVGLWTKTDSVTEFDDFAAFGKSE